MNCDKKSSASGVRDFMFEYFLKSKYKTLLWFNRFLARFNDINKAFLQIEKQNKRGVNNEF